LSWHLAQGNSFYHLFPVSQKLKTTGFWSIEAFFFK
jgi:hypothetical protein